MQDMLNDLFPGPDNPNNLPVLVLHSQIQDNLLQSYRNIHLTLQSILLAIGVGLCVALMSFKNPEQRIWLFFMMIGFGILATLFLSRLRRIVVARGKDVNFWHLRILVTERELEPRQRAFTLFKIKQKLHRMDAVYLERFVGAQKVSPEDLEKLLDKGLTHTRKVLDLWLFYGIAAAWMLLLITGLRFLI